MTPRTFDEIHNILLIQGDGQDAQSVRDALANGSDRDFRVEWVKSCAMGLERLAARPPHDREGPNAISAILVDLMLPDLAGLGSVDRLVTAVPQIPIIVLCSMQDELVAKEAIRHGAQDYLLKEHLNSYLLPKTLAGVIERASITEALFDEQERAQVTLNSIGDAVIAVMVFRDVSTARALTLKLAYMAQHDTLTDLPNRSLLNDRLGQAIGAAQRHHGALALLYLDLDRFKLINDSLGHLVGDQLLQRVALRLSECVRTTDTVSRLGGDEFVILLSEVAHEQDAAHCADKLLEAFRMPFALDAHELHVTASIGIVVHPGDGTAAETLLQNADSAMYEAKKHGRNNYQFYRADLNSTAGEQQALENGLRHAIARKELELYYQPIMSLSTGAIDGVEALIRWRHYFSRPLKALDFPVSNVAKRVAAAESTIV